MKNIREYVVISPEDGEGVKDAFKKSASEEGSILYGFKRFSMPMGATLMSFEEALEKVKVHKAPSDRRSRRGQAFVLILENGDYLFYVDYQTSLPSRPIPVYQVLLKIGEIDYLFEVATYADDAEDYARAELYNMCGNDARGATLVGVDRKS